MSVTKGPEQWEIESDADCVMRARRIKKDKKRWPKVKAELVKRQQAIKAEMAGK